MQVHNGRSNNRMTAPPTSHRLMTWSKRVANRLDAVRIPPLGPRFRGLHSSTSQLNLSRVCHKKTPYTPLNTPSNPFHHGLHKPLRTSPIPYKALKLS